MLTVHTHARACSYTPLLVPIAPAAEVELAEPRPLYPEMQLLQVPGFCWTIPSLGTSGHPPATADLRMVSVFRTGSP